MSQPRSTRSLGLRRETYYRLSPAGRRLARRIAFAPLDAWTMLRGRPVYNGIPLPLRGEVFTGGGDFLTVGRQFLGYFERLGGLRPSDAVLEVGSGQGRMAIPLTAYLDEHGTYVGFDIVPDMVEDCRRRISSRFPAFTFIALPIHNDLYTVDGDDAARVRFPLHDASIDFAFATSVFTHMEPEAIERYLAEAHRVVRPGGRIFATLFHMDAAALDASTGAAFRFPHRDGDAWYMSLRTRSANVAIADVAWAAMVERTGWRQEALHAGTWSGRTGPTLDFQDIAVLRHDGGGGS